MVELKSNRQFCAKAMIQKLLFVLAFGLLPLGSWAQSSLPPCPVSDYLHNCFGTEGSQGSFMYVGEFRENRRNGTGTLTVPSGDRYVGEFLNDTKHGIGTLTVSDGARYVGEFRSDKRNGQGIEYHADGKVNRSGRWENDKLVQSYTLDTSRFPFNRPGQAATTPTLDPGKAERDRLAAEVEAERKKRETLEARLAAETKERERLAAEAKERERQLAEAKERERLAAEAKERERQLAEAKERERLATEAKEKERQLAEAKERERQQVQASQRQHQTQAVLRNDRRLALVIGNDSYKSVQKLVNAKSDARAIAKQLEASGFKVTLQFDLTERAMKDALRAFRTSVEGGDEVIVFFAGHGVQLGAANYLLPVDIRGDSEEQVKDEAIPLQRVLDDLSERKARFSLAIVDACRDNPFKGSGRAIGGRGLAPAAAASGQMVIFSAGAGQQALDRLGDKDKDPNGLFTRIFLKEMAKPGVPIDRVVRTVRNEVVQMAKSVGHEQVPALYDQTLGDFFFVR